MRLIPIPLVDEDIIATAPHWLPFLPKISQRSKESIETLIKRVISKEMRLVLVWDDESNAATALVGIRIHQRNGLPIAEDLIGELIWLAGTGRKAWVHLLPELEQLLRLAGCVECRPFCRPGWSKVLKAAGYKLTHIQMEKSLGQLRTTACTDNGNK